MHTCITASCFKNLESQKIVLNPRFRIISGNEEDLWLHSYSSSILVKDIIAEERINCNQKTQLSVLMHDIGKIVLMHYNASTYSKVLEEAKSTGTPQYILERKRLGVDHAEVGGWLLQAWELDDDQIMPISLHHSKDTSSEWTTEIALIQFVDYCDNIARDLPAEEPDAAYRNAFEHKGPALVEVMVDVSLI